MPDSNAAMIRLVAIHVGLVAAPVLLIALALRLWILALPLALVVGVAVTAWRLRDVDGRVTRLIGARAVTADDEPRLAGLAENVAMAVGVPVPRLHVIDSDALNALSWGVGNGPVHLAVTRGLLETADVVQLEAVVGHQLGSVRSRAVDVATLAGALYGPLARGPLTGPVVSLVRADEDRSIVLADLDGVRATRFPPGMVGVLERLRAETTRLDTVPPALGGLCFADPHPDGGPFAVHPPLDDRIDLLREI